MFLNDREFRISADYERLNSAFFVGKLPKRGHLDEKGDDDIAFKQARGLATLVAAVHTTVSVYFPSLLEGYHTSSSKEEKHFINARILR